MARHDDLAASAPADLPGDDFRRIAGIGAAIERRLHEAGIRTYADLAARTPEQLAASLSDVAGLSMARIVRQDWIGQASELAGPAQPPLPSEPSQRYASFHIELLLDVDDRVRRTKVHHHQSDTDTAWPGWDEGRLLAVLREHMPQPASQPDPEPAGAPPPAAALSEPQTASPSEPGTAVSADLQPDTESPPMLLPSSALRVESFGLTREGQRGPVWAIGEPIPIRLTLGVNRAGVLRAGALDFTAEVAAFSALGDDQRQPVGTARGIIRVDEPLSVDLTGQPLPRGLYRLETTMTVFTPEAQPLGTRSNLGALIQVAGAPIASAPK